MTDAPVVTVLVPARNEANDIERCLLALQAQTYDHTRMEIVVVDGASTDATVATVDKCLAATDLCFQVVPNASATTPSNLNAGLALARGRILCRVDARSVVPPDYVERCVAVLDKRGEVAVVGGAQIAEARDASATATGIARALNNRWGMGLARYRRGAASGPADTVYLGAFRTDELRAVGGWNDEFTTNQDFELNRRLSEYGLIWFESGLEVGYLPRPSLLGLARQYERFGRWKARYWRTTGDRPRPRQVVLLALPVVAVSGAAVTAVVAPRRLRSVVGLVVIGLAALFELRGPTGPRASWRGHVVSLVASVAVGGGWTVGAWRALLAPGRRRDRRSDAKPG